MTANALQDAPTAVASGLAPGMPLLSDEEDAGLADDGEQPPTPAGVLDVGAGMPAEEIVQSRGPGGPAAAAGLAFLPVPRSISPMLAFEPDCGDHAGAAVDDNLDDDHMAAEQAFTSSSPSGPWASNMAVPRTLHGSSRRSVNGAAQRPREEPLDVPRPKRHEAERGTAFHAPRPRRRPTALDYLVSESTTGIPRAALETKYRRLEMGGPRHAASGARATPAPSIFTGPDGANQHAESPLWEPDAPHSSGGGDGAIPPAPAPHHAPAPALPVAFGSPPPPPPAAPGAMPGLPFAHAPPPSVFQPGYGEDKAPMTGYELLAAKLVGGFGGPAVAPVYRRFDVLNHRLMLYMQADLADLEAELHALDSKDSVERGCGIIPASRRHERWSSTSLSQQRTEILGQIGYKLSQYSTWWSRARRTPAPGRDTR